MNPRIVWLRLYCSRIFYCKNTHLELFVQISAIYIDFDSPFRKFVLQ